MTKEEMKQKPKCPLSSGLLSSPTVYRKEKVTQQFWCLVITKKISLSAASRWESNLVSHIHTHTAESWIAVSLLLCFFEAPSHHHRSNKYDAELPQQRLTNQSTPTTNLTPLKEPPPPVGRQAPPSPQTG